MADEKDLKEELEALQTALKTEEDGYQYFKEAAERTTNPVAKKCLTSVAHDECEHISIIKNFYRALKEKPQGGMVELPKPPQDYRKRIKTIFQEAMKDIKEKVGKDTIVTDVYRNAMDLETKAADFYKKRREVTRFEQARKLYDWLFLFESDHYRMFSETLSYLENPNQWFLDEEKAIFEG